MATMVKSNAWATLLGKKATAKSFPFPTIKSGNLATKGNEEIKFRDLFRTIFSPKTGGTEGINLDPNVLSRVSGTVVKEVPTREGSGVAVGVPWDLTGQVIENKQSSDSRGNVAFLSPIPSQEGTQTQIGTPHPYDENDGIKTTESPKNSANGQGKSKKMTVSRVVFNPEKEIDTEQKAVFQRPVDGSAALHPHTEILGTESALSEAMEGNEKPRQSTRVPSSSTRRKPEQKAGSGSEVKTSMKDVHHKVKDVSTGLIPASSPAIDEADTSEEIKTHRSVKKAVVKDGSRPVPSPQMNSETSEHSGTHDQAFDASNRSIRQDSETADKMSSGPKI